MSVLTSAPAPSPPFLHTPYDGSKQPFSVGLEPTTEAQWLEPDTFLVQHLTYKKQLLESRRHKVVQAEPDTEAAQQEIHDLILSHLRVHQPSYATRNGTIVPPGLSAADVQPMPGDPPLVVAARLVQEDLVLMRKGPEGYRLAAACLCFPSSWSLLEKFRKSMHDIHVGVPGFNGTRLGNVVARIFDNLKPTQLVARFNWSIYDDDDLHHPEPKQIDPQLTGDGGASLAGLFIRVERQTLRRLPGSGDILFTIKIHHDPLELLNSHPNGGNWAAGLRQQLLGLDEHQLSYKGLSQHRATLAQALQDLASAPATS
ncbi:DUF3445 domain-containing protein [Roseibium sp. CAU 1637]|uniref:DUF3445 domain-containing protein n=1 Tax=Roseibium limicola TaxID=2816037 RepID=A0A939EQX4_9HYPH|nr:DUF3445 domain-containing protein [Roseibium limicola]MBO0346947.1 DUF3445 domain-containing protein [Roseibium limicola]